MAADGAAWGNGLRRTLSSEGESRLEIEEWRGVGAETHSLEAYSTGFSSTAPGLQRVALTG